MKEGITQQPVTGASFALSWRPARPMPEEHLYYGTSTLLRNGKVLVAGGFSSGQAIATAVLYDPATDTWSPTGSMAEARGHHAAALLPDGKVLVVAGNTNVFDAPVLRSAELYDPAAGTWAPAAPTLESLPWARAMRLHDGNIVVVGLVEFSHDRSLAPRHVAEIYDPIAGIWSSTEAAAERGMRPFQWVLLPSGRVLVVDGSGRVEVFDPATRTWSRKARPRQPRWEASLTLLPDGDVLLAGGRSDADTATCEVYSPATDSWYFAAQMTQPRSGHAALSLPNGRILVLGRSKGEITTETYDPATRTWSSGGSLGQGPSWMSGGILLPDRSVLFLGQGTSVVSNPVPGVSSYTGPLTHARSGHSATSLKNGQVLVAFGRDYDSDPRNKTTELYDPVSGTWSPAGPVNHAFVSGSPGPVLLQSGKVLVVNAGIIEVYDPDTGAWSIATSSLSGTGISSVTLMPDDKVLAMGFSGAHIYDPATTSWSDAGRLPDFLGWHTATVLPNGRVLVVGGFPLLSASAKLYDPVSGTWSSAGSLAEKRDWHTATSLPDGNVLVIGGKTERYTSHRIWTYNPEIIEMYDSTSGLWSSVGLLPEGRVGHTATLLPSGKVLILGGSGTSLLASSSLLYDPTDNSWLFVDPLNEERQGHTATLLSNGNILVAGGQNRSGVVSLTAELYPASAVEKRRPPARPSILVPAPNQYVFTSRPVLSGTAEPGSTVHVVVDGFEMGPLAVDADGLWAITHPQLRWGEHRVVATATDALGNTSAPSLKVAFTTTAPGHYGMNCAASPSAWQPWLLALLLAAGGLRRGRTR